jgi:two-component sensor histidine kinase
MHPIFSNFGRLLWYVVAWLLLGTLIAGLLAFAGDADWKNALFFAVPICFLYGFVAMSAYYVCRALPIAQRNLVRAATTFGAAALISGALLTAIGLAWAWFGRMLGTDWGIFELTRRYQTLLFGVGIGLYFLSLFAHDALIAMENLRAAERRESESRMLAREAELQALRAQINPHFLFNSLNSISALTTIDAAAAREMTIALAQFFRQTLALANREKISLADEMALCQNFLAVEKIRFGKKLAVDLHVDDAALRALIPPLTVQPLLENALKHGIHDLVDGGVIVVEIVAREAWLYISVSNPLNPEAQPFQHKGTGLGLQNIRLRLSALYDGRARVAWERRDAQRFAVELTIPFEVV